MDEKRHIEDHKAIDERSEGNRNRVLELVSEVNNISVRVHQLEDHFETEGIIDRITSTLHQLARDLEQLKDGKQRSRHPDPEHSVNGVDEPSIDASPSAAWPRQRPVSED